MCTLYGVFDGFHVIDFGVCQADFRGEPLLHQLLEYLQLHFAHDLDVDLLQLAIPQQLQLGIFLLQQPQLLQQDHRIAAAFYTVSHDRLQRGFGGRGGTAQALSGPGLAQTRYGAQCAGAYFVCGGEFLAGIDADGLDLFFLFSEGNALAHPELPAGDLQPGQAAALRIPGNFIHPGTKIGILPVFRGELIQNLQ